MEADVKEAIGLRQIGKGRLFAEMALVTVLPFLLLAPFANKAYHIDDTVYVWVAQHIHGHPLDFYGFEMNWHGTRAPVYSFNQNPPGVSYFLALVALFFGWGEAPLHLAMAAVASFGILGVYLLARELDGAPIIAALACATAPVYFVSANTVMSDSPMVTYYIWAVFLWVAGTRKNSVTLLLLAMLFCCLSIFHKYFGLTAVPLLFLYTLVEKRRVGSWAAYLVIPILFIGAYQAYTQALYGVSLFSGAAKYALDVSWEEARIPIVAKSFIGLLFLGGCLAGFLFYAPFHWSRSTLIRGAWIAVFAAGSVVLIGRVGLYLIHFVGRYNWPVVLHAAVFAVAGLNIIAIVVYAMRKRRDGGTLLLSAWIAGTFLFATYLNWSITARTILPLAPPAAIFLSVLLREKLASSRPMTRALYAVPLLCSAALSFSVAWGDFFLADAQRAAAYKFTREAESFPGQYYYKGHWGFQYYMDAGGIPDWDVKGLTPEHGDRIIMAENGSTKADFNADVARAWYDLRYSVPASSWVSTMHPYIGAGFYTHFWGPVPYAFGAVPLEYYAVYELGDFRDLPPPQ